MTQQNDRTALERVGSKIRGFLKLNYARVIDLFRRMDTSGDGEVDIEEFRTGLRALKLNLSDVECDHLFRQFDEDNSGTLEIAELDKAIRILKKPELKYSIETTVSKDGSTFGDMIPEMHGAKMEFLLTLENPSAHYRKDIYGEIGMEYVTSKGSEKAKVLRKEKFRTERAARMDVDAHKFDRLRTVSVDTQKKMHSSMKKERALRKREMEWILDGNKSVSDKYCSALTEYQSLFDPTMKHFFGRHGRRKNVAETFYYEEVSREQRKTMAMAAHQIGTYRNNASMRIFDERFRRVKVR